MFVFAFQRLQKFICSGPVDQSTINHRHRSIAFQFGVLQVLSELWYLIMASFWSLFLPLILTVPVFCNPGIPSEWFTPSVSDATNSPNEISDDLIGGSAGYSEAVPENPVIAHNPGSFDDTCSPSSSKENANLRRRQACTPSREERQCPVFLPIHVCCRRNKEGPNLTKVAYESVDDCDPCTVLPDVLMTNH